MNTATLEHPAELRERIRHAPVAELDPADPALYEHNLAHDVFARLRQESPIHHVHSEFAGPY